MCSRGMLGCFLVAEEGTAANKWQYCSFSDFEGWGNRMTAAGMLKG